jgi:hypothetical protein
MAALPASAAAASLEVAATGLPAISGGARYEAFVDHGNRTRLLGTLSFDSGGVARVELPRNVRDGDGIRVTVEAASDHDRRPSDTTVLHGELRDGAANLAFPFDLSAAAGEAVLISPTDNLTNAKNDEAGVWYPSLGLPSLPSGWRYEGWARTQQTLVSTGRFADPAARDSGNPFSGIDANPPIPGEDLLFHLPSSISAPVNLADGSSRVAITIEPDLNGVDPTGDAPFPIAPLFKDITTGQATGARFALDANAAAGPTAVATVVEPRATEQPRYVGPGHVAVDGSSAIGYRWHPRRGWRAVRVHDDARVYIYPFLGDWRWAYVPRTGWVALPASDLTIG